MQNIAPNVPEVAVDADFDREALALARVWFGDFIEVDQAKQQLASQIERWQAAGEWRLVALSGAFELLRLTGARRLQRERQARIQALRAELAAVDWPRVSRLLDVADSSGLWSRTELQQALARMQAHGPREADARPITERTWTEIRLSGLQAQLGELDAALAAGQAGLMLARQSGLDRLVTLALQQLVFTFISAGDVEGALIYLHEDPAASQRMRMDSDSRAYNESLALAMSGRLDEAMQLERLEAPVAGAAPRLRARESGEWAALQAYMLVGSGHTEAALAVLEGLNLAPGSEGLRPQLAANRAWLAGAVWVQAGQPQRALRLVDELLAHARLHDWSLTPMNRTQLHHVRADAAEALGDLRTAVEALREAQAACFSWVATSMRMRLQVLNRDQTQPDAGRLSHRLEVVAGAASQAVSDTRPNSPRFLAHVSHEIRNSLNGVIGMTSLLALSKLDERQRRYINLAQDSAQMLMGLCNDLLDLAKIEAGRFELDAKPTDVAALAVQVGEAYRLRTAPGVDLRWSLGAELPPRLLVDRLRLQQLLVNLVSNAVKFTARGRVDLSLSWRALEGRAGLLRVEVADTGPGLSETARASLFEEFYQADVPVAVPQGGGGSGLGLALCRALVQRMEGRIGVDSEVGVGSRFWFELPLERPEDAA